MNGHDSVDFDYQAQQQENQQFDEDLENINKFNQEVEEDSKLEDINFEIQQQAAKLTQLTEEDELLINEQPDTGRPASHQVLNEHHFIDNPNYVKTYTVQLNQQNEKDVKQKKMPYSNFEKETQNSYNEGSQNRPSDDTNLKQPDSQNDSLNKDSKNEENFNSNLEDPSNGTKKQSNLTLSSVSQLDGSTPNLTNGKYSPIHNNIFLIQTACGKLKKILKESNQANEEERSNKKLKKHKGRRNQDQQHKKNKRKRKKRQKKKIILIEEDNYMPAYKNGNRR